MTVEQGLMTADDLLRLPDDGMRHELVRGELHTMAPPGFHHGRLGSRLGRSLSRYVEDQQLGEVITLETGYLLATSPDLVRVPDLAFIAQARIHEIGDYVGYFPGAPDLVVEVISPNDLYTEVDEKVAEWLEHGTKLVFVVNPRRRTVAVHRADGSVRILTVADTLDGEDVVPGWTLAVRDIFE